MSLNFLTVDDSAIVRKVLRRILSMISVEVREFHEANTGELALAVLKAHPVDIAFVDINMPGMGGVRFIQEAIQTTSPQACPTFIVVSAEQNETVLASLRALGVERIIAKPFRPEDIVRALEGLNR